MNRLFKRQLNRHFGKDFDIESLEPKMKSFLLNVADTYDEIDKEKRLLENTVDLNSSELFMANKQIVRKNEDLNNLLKENAKLLKNRIEENKEIGTELKQYKQAMDSALLVNIFDLNGAITLANDNFCEICALSSYELIGKDNYEIFSKYNGDELRDEIFLAIRNKEIWNGQLKYENKNFEVFNLKATIFPILNANGEITQYMSIFQDITEIENSRQKALELDRAKSLFIANMSHELRTPLNSIIGFSQIMKKQNEIPEKSRAFIEKINQSGEHLLKLINAILDFSKIESGEVHLEKEKIDLRSMISMAISQQETQANEKNLSVNARYDEKMAKTFLGDSMRITQILTNLLANAIKFTSHGGVEIIASQERKNRVRIEVRDTGIGLDEEEQKRLFKEFSQADNSTTRKYGGTGLGLSISKKLVELMQGEIWIESVKGEGSGFIFEIDLREFEDDSEISQLEETLVTDVAEEKKFSGKNALLVEANAMNRFLISGALENASVNLDVANNSIEALEFINSKKRRYDIIFMDLQAPATKDFEAALEIRKIDETTPIVALVSNAQKEEIQKIKQLGLNEYLYKPIDFKVFHACLLKYLS